MKGLLCILTVSISVHWLRYFTIVLQDGNTEGIT